MRAQRRRREAHAPSSTSKPHAGNVASGAAHRQPCFLLPLSPPPLLLPASGATGATRVKAPDLVVVALGLNLASELVSFSRLIDAIAPFRWFDRLGSRRS